MKKHMFSVLFLAILLLGCEAKVVKLELENAPTRLVIDGQIEFDKSQAKPAFEANVKVSQTAPYYAIGNPPMISGASISITDTSTNETFALQEKPDEKGSYHYTDTKASPKKNVLYRLNIVYNGEKYVAEDMAVDVPTIEGAIGKKDETRDQYVVKVRIKDDPDKKNYYMLRSYTIGKDYVENDKFFNGNEYELWYTLEGETRQGSFGNLPTKGGRYELRLYSFSDKYGPFLKIAQRGKGFSQAFSPPPSTPKSNIINTTNPNTPPIGGFYVAEYATINGVLE